jgi:hypothetical protein
MTDCTRLFPPRLFSVDADYYSFGGKKSSLMYRTCSPAVRSMHMVHLAWAILYGMVLAVVFRGSMGGGETQVVGEGRWGDSGFLQGS